MTPQQQWSIARLRSWCSLIERSAPDGDNRLIVDADVAAEHARDLLSLIALVNRPLPSVRDIAKIIDPKAFDPPYDKFDDVHNAVNADRRDALAKAVQILDLIGGAGPQGGA